ncbi:hypothetical protein ACVJF1_001119 [Bradyrhizobium diazoefficiens]
MRGTVELHELQQFVDPRCDIRCRCAQQFRRDPDIVGDAQVREQPAALEDVADPAPQRDRIDVLHVLGLDRDGAEIRLDQPVGKPQQRGLARARAADDGHKLALGDVQRHVVHGLEGAEALGDMGIADGGLGRHQDGAHSSLPSPSRGG